MTDPLKGRKIEIGGKLRTIKFNNKAIRIAQLRFGGQPVREIMRVVDVHQTCELAAAGLFHELPNVSADLVGGWLDKEPNKFFELSTAVIESITEYYGRMTKEKVDAMGEASAPVDGESDEAPTTTT
jgi:hypothetical protein